MLDTLPLQSRMLPVAFLFCWVMISSCGGDLPPEPGDPEDTVRLAPLGMPDWSQPQYDWIDKWDSSCREYTYMRDWWEPKFSLIVMGISPDGGTLLLRRGRGLLLYDTASRSIRTALAGGYEYASWSSDGRYIATVAGNRPVIVDLEKDSSYALRLGDTVGMIGTTVQWLPGDSAIVVMSGGNGSASGGHFAVGIHPPHATTRLLFPRYARFGSYNGSIAYLVRLNGGTGTGNYDVALKLGNVGDTSTLTTFPLPGVRDFSSLRISPNGDWLAFKMDADLRGSRFHEFLGLTDKITSLGIIDLREDSPTRYKLYRVFPDYTHFFRVCANLFTFSEGVVSPDGRYAYHERARLSDSTVQIVRRDIATGEAVEISNFLTPP